MQTAPIALFDDAPHDECGVFGVYAPGSDVARLTYFGLYALQHRGQESAGIVTSDGRTTYSHKDVGLVAQVFNEDNMRPLVGHMAVGHVRYSTTGGNHLRNVQPYLIETIYGPLSVGHNGNLTNAVNLRYKLLERGVGMSSTSDTEVITQWLAAPATTWEPYLPDDFVYDKENRFVTRMRAFMHIAEGAYSLTVMTRDAVYAVRDPNGLRPLCIGKLDGGYVFASETCALLTIGAEFVREVRPGEIVRLDANGLYSEQAIEPKRRALCVFEYVYFARPDSNFEGQSIHGVRQRMGHQLAKEAPVEADAVIAVPDSATPAAIGLAQALGVPFTEGLTKNRYIGRTFIQPSDELRKQRVKLKYNVLDHNLRGKRVVLVDDSIVRGNTVGPIVNLLRQAGAAEVHVRVSSPPVRHPCFMGVDMATYNQLIAHHMNIEEIRQHIGADSLHYLSLPGMMEVVQSHIKQEHGHCNACFSGDYPIKVPEWLFEEDREKLIFEGVLH